MSAGIAYAVAGLGVFLLGMVVMTEGLTGLAGEAVRRGLARFTSSPVSGALTGATATAVVQSSSATTVAAVGFVGAGLLTFPQALGVVFGANLGTTVTGWLVAVLGFKLDLAALLLPLILPGVMLRLFARGRVASAGFALAGFSLLFFGLVLLQQGMKGLEGLVTPATFPPDSVGGRLVLVVIGAALTVITQSSSAGVAAALAAVSTETITFTQAAAMVIGMDVGTTVTAALATIGGSASARRTGYAHVAYNLMTGAGAFLLLSPYVALWNAVGAGALQREPELALVGFHTLFNAIGVAAVLPLAGRFAALMTRLVPETGPRLTRRLDRSLRQHPEAAMGALEATVTDLVRETLGVISTLLVRSVPRADLLDRLHPLREGLGDTRLYLDGMTRPADREATYDRYLSVMHAIDHVDRALDRCEEMDRGAIVRQEAESRDVALELASALGRLHAGLAGGETAISEDHVRDVWERLQQRDESHRREVLERAAAGELDSHRALDLLDGTRWLRRVAYHCWRIVHHLRRARGQGELEQQRSAELPPRGGTPGGV